MNSPIAPQLHQRRGWLVAGAALCGLLLVAIAHISSGSSDVGLGDLLTLLTGNTNQQVEAIFIGSRLPRMLAGLVAGIALGYAGALIQGATRNPLAGPETLGVNAGAYLAIVAFAAAGIPLGIVGSGIAAFIGGITAAGLVYLLLGHGPTTSGRVLLAGTALAFVAAAITNLLLILEEQRTQGLFFWGRGSLLQVNVDRPIAMGILVLVGVFLALLLARGLDLLTLGDETAAGMGIHVRRIRLLALLLAVIFAAAAATVAGPISFVGIVAPVVLRAFSIRRHAWLLPLSGVLGAIIVLGADTVVQTFFVGTSSNSQLPVGVISALLGGPLFMVLARKITTGDADTGAIIATRMSLKRHTYALTIAVLCAVLLAAILLGLHIGSIPIAWSDLASLAIGQADLGTQLLAEYRFPRVVIAALAGVGLAAAGAAAQAVVRNPLAEPTLLGITGGAGVGAVALITFAPGATFLLPWSALIGGLIALLIVIATAWTTGKLDPTRIVLIGIGMAATTQAIIEIMALGSQLTLSSALTWMAGTTYGRDFAELPYLLAPFVIAILLTIVARPVDITGLGDELPRSLGLSLNRARLLTLAAAAIAAAGTAAAVGTVGFVGLVAPHLARRVVGSSYRRMVPVAGLLGAILVVCADTVGRSALESAEMPVGIVTALIGTPYLVWLLWRGAKAR